MLRSDDRLRLRRSVARRSVGRCVPGRGTGARGGTTRHGTSPLGVKHALHVHIAPASSVSGLSERAPNHEAVTKKGRRSRQERLDGCTPGVPHRRHNGVTSQTRSHHPLLRLAPNERRRATVKMTAHEGLATTPGGVVPPLRWTVYAGLQHAASPNLGKTAIGLRPWARASGGVACAPRHGRRRPRPLRGPASPGASGTPTGCTRLC